MVGGWPARPQSLAVASVADRHFVRQWTSHGDHLAPSRWRQRRLRRLFTFLPALDARPNRLLRRLSYRYCRTLPLPKRLLLVIDDSPTKRYGPKVEGADVHHNPTPGPADRPVCLRPYLGHDFAGTSASGVGNDWPASSSDALCSQANHGDDSQVAQLAAVCHRAANWQPVWSSGSFRC